MHQASLSGTDPFLPTANTVADGGVTEAEQRAGSSWGSQLDLAGVAPPMQDILELDYEDDDEDASEILLSDDKYEDEMSD